MSSISFLPEYLLSDVFARLPTESLLQIRAVSKSWCDIIDSPEFIKLHLNQSVMDGKGRKIIWLQSVRSIHSIMNEKIWKLYTAEFDSLEKFQSTAVEVKYPCWGFNAGYISVVGSCNGLLCVNNSKFGMFLWNPSIRKYWKLPLAPIGIESSEKREMQTRYGFGYDDTSDDYKVVKMVGDKRKGSRPKRYEVKIYSLKSHSWKQLQDFPFAICDTYVNRHSGVLANCALHWMVGSEDSKKGKLIYPFCIAALDLRTEEYRFLQLPEFSKDLPWNFEALDGCLSIVCCNRVDPADPSSVQMWIMKDYGKEDSWSKFTLKIPVDNPYPTLFPIAYSDSNRSILLFETQLQKALWYDTQSRSVQKLEVLGFQRMDFVFPYVSSLVQPCGGRSKEIKKCSKLQKEKRKRSRV